MKARFAWLAVHPSLPVALCWVRYWVLRGTRPNKDGPQGRGYNV